MKLTIIGWIGAAAFALCGAPQAYQSYMDGHSNGISWGLLLLWLIGELCTIIYVFPKKHWPLLFNYVGNIVFLIVIIYFKLFPSGQ